MKFIKIFYFPLRDLFLHVFPVHLRKREYHFGFLVHPRDEKDVITKYPFLQIVPTWVIRIFTRWYWPITVTKITGLKSLKNGQKIDGFIFSIPLITTQILEDRTLAVRRIRQAVTLAKRMGVNIIGLGALTASVTRGGEDLSDIKDMWITTGHAYTGFNVTENLFNLEEVLDIDKKEEHIAILGAAGSIGSISAELIARRGYRHIQLIDLERKMDRVSELCDRLQKTYPGTSFSTSSHVQDIKHADFIIAATNTPEALITEEMLKPGAVVIDDAQPSDVGYGVLLRKDVLAIEAGVVHTPGISSNFNLGLKDTYDNFCCMAEVLILAANEWDAHYVIKRTTLDFVDNIISMGAPLHFRVANLQNRKERIPDEKLTYVANVRKKALQ